MDLTGELITSENCIKLKDFKRSSEECSIWNMRVFRDMAGIKGLKGTLTCILELRVNYFAFSKSTATGAKKVLVHLRYCCHPCHLSRR